MVKYDKLIIGVGVKTNTFGIESVKEGDGIFFLKHLFHARNSTLLKDPPKLKVLRPSRKSELKRISHILFLSTLQFEIILSKCLKRLPFQVRSVKNNNGDFDDRHTIICLISAMSKS